MNVARRRGAVAALIAAVLLTGAPAYGAVGATEAVGATGAVGVTGASRGEFAAALHRTGAMMRVAVARRQLPRVPGAAAPFAAPRDVSGTATATPFVLIPPLPTTTPLPTTVTAPVTPTATPAVTSTATALATATPPPTATPSPRPPTRTPRPTQTPRPTAVPPTATPRAIGVKLVAVEVATLNHGREQRVNTAALGTTLRLRIVVAVSGLGRDAHTRVTATWALRSILRYSRDFSLTNGRMALYDDVVLPTQGLAMGAYFFTGSIAYHGAVQEATTVLHVVGEGTVQQATRVHYAHLRLTVPRGWKIDFKKDSSGRAATGPSSLIMFSPSNRAAVSVVSVALKSIPSSADLHAFPQLVLQQEFDKVTNAKVLNVKSQIDGQDVFAAQANVTLQAGDNRTSQALALVTDKNRQLYAFTVVDLFNQAPRGEIQDALAAILGSKLD